MMVPIEPPPEHRGLAGLGQGEGEERGGPDWGNWERKMLKSEILAGGRAAEINLLKQNQRPKPPLGGGVDLKGTGAQASSMRPAQGFIDRRARPQPPPGTHSSTRATLVVGSCRCCLLPVLLLPLAPLRSSAWL